MDSTLGDKFLALHLNLQPPAGSLQPCSGFVAALRDARLATGRDPSTGAKLPDRRDLLGPWLGAVGYMTLLDQIGSCFQPKGQAAVKGNTIRQALSRFTSLDDQRIDAIYALRCAFAHDYSLYNSNRKNPGLTHHFAVGIGGSNDLVILPKTRWGGDYKRKNDDTKTTVNLEVLGDLVEEICRKIIELAARKELEIVLPGGAQELISRYGFYRNLQ